ncbi:peptidoglycan-binding protein [Aurantimonas sp. Leaf443]|uniref:peptidoglycan-binding protein n=1 Tax=Aurantimonas sp. Leaf443 TaxID=1736378 RepID=UPI0006F6516C|nr:peptidoglycan-binding protein [Aurantimonas sp. Leaf443]KQT85907.1 hypothetical protein ASG48_04690 [Aurantimonas sp. Leaf443]
MGEGSTGAPDHVTPASQDTSSLATLSRTLEQLEARLASLASRRAAPPAATPSPEPAEAADPARAALSDAVSQIVMRQKMLDGGAPLTPRPRMPNDIADLAERLQGLTAQGDGNAALSGVFQELQLIRQEMKADVATRLDTQFADMRAAFDALAAMIEGKASAAAIAAEITQLDSGLQAMEGEGADEVTIGSLRRELRTMGELVAGTAREDSVQTVNRRWDALEERFAGQAEEEILAKRDLRQELEMLRASLGGLASGEQVKAVERRWDDLEDRLAAGGTAPDGGGALSDLLKGEIEKLGGKLETLATDSSLKAVEARWGALEERFAGREIETKMEAMAARIAELESSLARLPDSLPIASLEQRVRSLAVNVEALVRHAEEPDVEHFLALEERLDEISRAIVSSAARPAAIVDMSPVERIEARLQTLSARVDDMASESLTQELAERLQAFGTQLDALASGPAAVDTSGIEARLTVLMARLEDVAASRVDEDVVRTLEAQIVQLSQRIGESGVSGAVDPEIDRRLAAVERRLDENRDQILVAARAAADEAVRQVLESGDQREGLHIARLSEDLRSLEALSRAADKRSSDFFEIVHETLVRLVGRIDEIEAEIVTPSRGRGGKAAKAARARGEAAPAVSPAVVAPDLPAGAGAPSAAAPRGLSALARHLPFRKGARPDDGSPTGLAEPQGEVALVERPTRAPEPIGTVEAPSVDAADLLASAEVNRPLAIGSGAPDIAALIERARAQQRERSGETVAPAAAAADHITAARRAAMAAASEVEKLRGEAMAQPSGGLASFVSRSRKPILMAVGAVLLAMMAVPLGKMLMAPAQIEATDVPVEATPALPAEPASVDAAAQTPAAPAEMPATEASTPQMPTAASSDVSTAPAEPAPVQPAPLSQEPAAALAAPFVSPTIDAAAPLPAVGAAARAASLAELPADAGTPQLRAAVERGEPKALFEVGLRLMEGRYGDPNPKAAVGWFEQSATLGFAPAQYSLGTLYEKGNGVAQDTVKARDWYLAAARSGNVRAMHNLAVLYATGVDGASDPQEAASWFRQAAEYGMTDSQYNLGILYARGAGLPQDFAESYRWFSIVALRGDKDADAKRDEVRKTLSPEKVAEIDAAVAAYAPKARDEAANTVDVPKEWALNVDAGQLTATVDMKRAIRNVQAILGKLGYQAGTPDGVIGARTTEAIRAFQKDAGLTVTGQVDEPLVRALLARKDG